MKMLPLAMLMLLGGCSDKRLTTSVSTHLMFQGSANEAIELYKSVFPEFIVDRQELHDSGEMKAKVRLAYATFAGQNLIIYDSPPVHDFTFTPSMSLFVEFEDAGRLRRAFERLSEKGEVAMPLDKYEFSPLFGWLQDQYGVSWQFSLKNKR